MSPFQIQISSFVFFGLFVLFLILYVTKKSNTTNNVTPKLYNVVMSFEPGGQYTNGVITWNNSDDLHTIFNGLTYDVIVSGATIYDLNIINSAPAYEATFKLTVEAAITGNNNCTVRLAGLNSNYMLAEAGDNSQLEQSVTGIQCILGNANLLLEDGSCKRVDQLHVGDKLAQVYSHAAHGYDSLSITEVVKTTIKDFKNNALEDSRLFSSNDGKLILTFWHKILFEGKYVLPIHHPLFNEIFMDKEFTVYNFRLEKSDGVLITESNYILESLS